MLGSTGTTGLEGDVGAIVATGAEGTATGDVVTGATAGATEGTKGAAGTPVFPGTIGAAGSAGAGFARPFPIKRVSRAEPAKFVAARIVSCRRFLLLPSSNVPSTYRLFQSSSVG